MLVLCDQAGILDMTAEALARRTTIPLEVIQAGIAALEQPDDQSRSPAEQGRRIVRLNPDRPWGWQIVNHAQYRAIRNEDDRRAYMRGYMADVRAGKPPGERGKGSPEATKPPAKARTNGAAKANCGYHPDFLVLWAEYPRHEAKADAAKAWAKISPDRSLQARILAAVAAQRECMEWRKEGGRYIPHLASWLNARRWEDEIAKPAERPFPI